MDPTLLLEVAALAGFLGAMWILPDWARYRNRVLALGRRLGLVRPEPVAPTGPPIERIAADARRIHAQLSHAPPGTPVARRRGWLEAYDDVLVDACRALGLEERLGDLPPGAAREMERRRVERVLGREGLQLTDQ